MNFIAGFLCMWHIILTAWVCTMFPSSYARRKDVWILPLWVFSTTLNGYLVGYWFWYGVIRP